MGGEIGRSAKPVKSLESAESDDDELDDELDSEFAETDFCLFPDFSNAIISDSTRLKSSATA